MPDHLSFLSWNVENFHSDQTRAPRVIDFIVEHDPDVFGLYEVKGRQVFEDLVQKMPDYHSTVTESESVPEILIGVRNSFFSFVTQKNELNAKVPSLRPGALATVTVGGKRISLLFLHLKSFDEPRSWGLRDDMFKHVASLKRKIERDLPDDQAANFIALGDLNTMGMSAAYNDELDIDGTQELGFVDNRMEAKVNGMRRLAKSHDVTWWNGKDTLDPSDLDHVYAAKHLAFEPQPDGSPIGVRGWVQELAPDDRLRWIDEMSDHCALIGRLKVSSAL